MPEPTYELLGVRSPRPGLEQCDLVLIRKGARDKVIFVPLSNVRLLRLAEEAIKHISAFDNEPISNT